MNDTLAQMFDERKLGGMGLASLLPGVRFIREIAQKYEAAMLAELNARHEAETAPVKRRGRPRKVVIPGLTVSEQRTADTLEAVTATKNKWTVAEICQKAGIGGARVLQIAKERSLGRKSNSKSDPELRTGVMVFTKAEAESIFNRKAHPAAKAVANHPRNPGHPGHAKFIKHLGASARKARKARLAQAKAAQVAA